MATDHLAGILYWCPGLSFWTGTAVLSQSCHRKCKSCPRSAITYGDERKNPDFLLRWFEPPSMRLVLKICANVFKGFQKGGGFAARLSLNPPCAYAAPFHQHFFMLIIIVVMRRGVVPALPTVSRHRLPSQTTWWSTAPIHL
jgi:hypothetical protein